MCSIQLTCNKVNYVVFVELGKIVKGQEAVIGEVEDRVPILHGRGGGLVNVRQQEYNPAPEIHLVPAHIQLEQSLRKLPRESPLLILRELLPTQDEVAILVQLYKLDIENVKLVVGEVFNGVESVVVFHVLEVMENIW